MRRERRRRPRKQRALRLFLYILSIFETLEIQSRDFGFYLLIGAPAKRELVFLTLQFLKDNDYIEAMHRLERESGIFFSTEYLDEKILAGEWDEVDSYLSGFTKIEDNQHSMKTFFEIRKQKYLEALDRMFLIPQSQQTNYNLGNYLKSWTLPVAAKLLYPVPLVVRLLYMNSGVGILALGSDGIQRLWRWVHNEQNPNGKATTSVVPQLWQPKRVCLMANDVSGVNLEGATSCIALSNNNSYIISAVGGKASLFNVHSFKVMATFMQPPRASTFLAFHPQDNNLIAVGMEDSMIQIYNVQTDEVRSKLKGHNKRITGLAFSSAESALNVLVSSGADAQICFWSIDTWEKKKSVGIEIPAGKAANGDTRVQFHVDQICILAVHETQLAIFDASEMTCIRRWITQSGPISSAVFACNGQLIYTAFRDGNIGVFDTDGLRLRCRISPSAYLPQGLSPLVVAANPKEPTQFAVGLSDGSVKVIEPTEAEAKWGTDAFNT